MPGFPPSFVVYIVDDDDSVRISLSRLMRASRMRAEAFATAEEFLEAISPESAGCVLLDLSMPRMTGLEVQARLRSRSIGLPVIAVSARDDPEVRESAFALGAKFFLRKPVDDQALLDAIAWMQTSGGRTDANDKVEPR